MPSQPKKEIDANAELDNFLKEHKQEVNFNITFPIYRILPAEVELALKVLEKHGMKISIILTPQDKA